MIGWLVANAATCGRTAGAREPAGDPFLTTIAALTSAHSYKVRAQAALVLGRRREARATPYLVKALSDSSAVVRAVSAEALADIGGVAARAPLEAAAADRDAFVRRAASAALAKLARAGAAPVPASRPRQDATIVVKQMGDRTHRASPQLRDDMRHFVADELEQLRGDASGAFAVDGAIKTLGVSSAGAQVAVTCGVELILSAGRSGAIIVMSTGEATVQKPRRSFRPAMQRSMEQEALAHAVRGATDELRHHLAANVP